MNKPAYLTQPPKKMHGADGDEGDDAGKDGRKRLKSIKEGGGKLRDLGTMVQNGSQVAKWKLPTVKHKAIFTPETNAAPPPPPLMPQALLHATSGMSKDSVTKNVTAGGPIRTLNQLLINLHSINGSRN
jgi:hypothetical protein